MPYVYRMEWYCAVRVVPKDKQVVLISIKGVYYIAEFQEGDRLFKTRDELGESYFKIESSVFWTEFSEP
jgi:hypothetical protein